MTSADRAEQKHGFFSRHWLAVLLGAFVIVVTFLQQRELRSLERRLEVLEGDRGVAFSETEEQSQRESPRPPDAKSPPRRESSPEWPTCHGRIDDNVLREVVATRGAELHRCYERRLASRPGLLGGVLLEVMVLEDGSIADVRTSGTLVDEEVRSCLSRLARELELGPAQEGECAVVSLPFAFRPPEPTSP